MNEECRFVINHKRELYGVKIGNEIVFTSKSYNEVDKFMKSYESLRKQKANYRGK